MSRPEFLVALTKTLCLSCAGISLSCAGISFAAAPNNAGRPNIILVMADEQGWGDAGYNGHPFVQTPALDAMTKDGFVFDRFYAAAPVCSPTRASVMTGRNPIRTKVTNHGRYMRPHEQTIAETLKAAGYVTGIFGTEERSKPMGFWHNMQGGQGTWSDRIQKAIMEKQHSGAPLPNDPPRMRKDVVEFPQFPEHTAHGHAAWNDWAWKLHRINGKRFELYNLTEDPMEETDLSKDPQHA